VLVVAGPNLTLDRTLTIDELRPGEVLRFTSAAVTPGGKGVNVARVARALGKQALLVCLAPGRTGAAAAALLRDEEIDVVDVAAPGEVRVAAVVLEARGRVTVLNEPGPELPPPCWAVYEQAVDAALEQRRGLVCSGSLPPGAPADAYARLARIARRRGAFALVDAAGPALDAALPAADVVTPNLSEAENVLGAGTPDGVQPPAAEARERALAAAAGLVRRGARTAVVTAGEAGVAVAGDGEPSWYQAPPARTVRNPVGAGDSFAAGLALALADGAPIGDAIGAGLATAAASVETDVAGLVDPRRVRELAGRELALDEPVPAMRYVDPGDDDVVGGARGRPEAADA
jgi:1-phosphofructokinase family hexose kinase